MVTLIFKLYRFIISTKDYENLTIYVVALEWPQAFNTVYSHYGDEVNISLAERVGIENNNFIISPDYLLSNQINDATIINGMDVYDNF